MIDIIKGILDSSNSYNLDIDLITSACLVLILVSVVLCVKFLFDFVRGLFPSFK